MSRNGSGTYSLPAGNPVVTGTVISSTVQNNTLNDIATALTQSIASTGVTTPTANLPMGGFRHTGVGNASAQACYGSVTDIQNGSLITLTGVAGSDTITGTAPFTVAAYATGQSFRFVAAGSNTGAVTINVSSLGAKAITKEGTNPLSPGDISLGQVVEITYDGTRFQMIGARSSATVVVAMQAFTTSGTYTPTSGTSYIVVHMVGGGAGGAQLAAGSAGGAGGSAGEYATGVFSAASIGASQVVTIGAGGAANSAGGNTSLGALLIANGASASTTQSPGAGGTGGGGSGLHIPGGQAQTGSAAFSGPVLIGGSGGASFFGSGGRGGVGNIDAGANGLVYGSGGGGNGLTAGNWGSAGSGAGGAIVIYEYF